MSAEDIATAFITQYYAILDSNPAGLASLYQAQSSLTFEGTKIDGPDAIIAKYASLGPIAHNVPMLTKDVQISIAPNAMLIFVTGQLKIGPEGNPLLFSHVFHLVASAPNQYYIHNEIFRLVYG
eukprot:gene10404-13974_t